MSELMPLLHKLVNRQNLSSSEATDAFRVMANGGATPAQMAAFLTALKMKGETVDELYGAAYTLRHKAPTIAAPKEALDSCGTGGDGAQTFNISTCVAIILSACGVPMAKHGNRAVSSSCGSADVLEALGVTIDASQEIMERCLREIGLCFIMAPRYHKAMHHIAPVRKELGMRTIFNLVGPLINPARTQYQLLGVYDRGLCPMMAETLKKLGSGRAWVVHGADGLDEITLTGSTFVSTLDQGEISHWELDPRALGLELCAPEDLQGGNAQQNAAIIRAVLKNEPGPKMDIVLLNAAAGLVIAGKVDSLEVGLQQAKEAIASGSARNQLHELISCTSEHRR